MKIPSCSKHRINFLGAQVTNSQTFQVFFNLVAYIFIIWFTTINLGESIDFTWESGDIYILMVL